MNLCPCCGLTLAFDAPWFRCVNCGHRIHDITPEDNAEYHRDFRNRKAMEGDIRPDGYLDVHRYRANRMDLLSSRVLAVHRYLPGSGTMWDFGCGGGYMLAYYRAAGFEVIGTEVDPLAIFGMQELKIPFLFPEDIKDETVDMLTLWHVLEHLDDPLDMLHGLLAKVKPGGIVVLEVPVDRQYDGFIGHRHEFARESFPRFILQIPVHPLVMREGIQKPAVLYVGRKA